MFHFIVGKLEHAVFGPPDVGRVAERLVRYALKRGFRTFRTDAFRKPVRFDELEIVERDRMFNELVASNIVLVLLMVDTFNKLTARGVAEYFRDLCQIIVEQFAAMLRSMGVIEEHVKPWLKLIDLRRDEYEEGRLRARDSLPELGEGNPWMRVVAVGCLFHIRRGKSIANDPLFSLFMGESIAVSDFTRRTVLHATRRL